MTSTTRPDVDMAALAHLMAVVESTHHRRGWRSSLMTVYTIVDTLDLYAAEIVSSAMGSIGEPIRARRYLAQPMMNDKMFAEAAAKVDQPAWRSLDKFAHSMAFVDTDILAADETVDDAEDLAEKTTMARQLLQLPGVVGFAACYEGYGLGALHPNQLEQIRATDDHLDSQPGAREGRMLILVDADDQVHTARRVRGSRPALEICAPMRGDVTNSLRKLMDLATERLPVTQEEHDARYQRPEQANSMFQVRRQPSE